MMTLLRSTSFSPAAPRTSVMTPCARSSPSGYSVSSTTTFVPGLMWRLAASGVRIASVYWVPSGSTIHVVPCLVSVPTKRDCVRWITSVMRPV